MKTRSHAVAAMLLLATSSAHASVYLDTLHVTNPLYASDGAFDQVVAMADSFTASRPDFSQITLELTRTAGDSTGSAMIFLVPDSGTGSGVGVPGVPLANYDVGGTFTGFSGAVSLGNIADSAVSASGSAVTLNFSPSLAASFSNPNQEYWIGLVLSPDSSIVWNYGEASNGIGEAGQLNYSANTVDGGGGFGIVDNTGATSTSAPYDLVVDTPEPASLTVLGISLAALGIRRYRPGKKIRL